MRITPDTVQRLADYASELTDGRFRFGYASNPGDGMRYVDGTLIHLTWSGRDAARKAAAYYYGVAESANPGTVGDLPDDVREAGRELVRWRESAVDVGRSAYTEWWQASRTTARTAPGAPQESTVPNYAQKQIDRVTADGPDHESGGTYRLKIWGGLSDTKTLSVTLNQLARIREALGE